MSVSELIDYYDVLQDKFGSPYFTTTEKEKFLTQAQEGIIADYLPKEGDSFNIEKNANTWTMFSPLAATVTTAMDSSGIVLKSTIESTLATNLGFTATIIRPLAVVWSDTNGTRPVKGPTRYNNWETYKNNSFKEPLESEPRYYENYNSYIIEPVSTSAIILVHVLRHPKPISLGGGVTAELAPIYHNEIIARALDAAGVGSRDQLLLELNQITKK